MTDRQKLAKAFAALRKQGYFAKVSFEPCCSSCGHYEIANGIHNENMPQKRRVSKPSDKYVFFNIQSKQFSMPTDMLVNNMYLMWGHPGNDATEIVQALKSAGLDADWNSDPGTGIELRTKESIK